MHDIIKTQNFTICKNFSSQNSTLQPFECQFTYTIPMMIQYIVIYEMTNATGIALQILKLEP